MQLVAAYRSGKDFISLQECLPPSEYGTFDFVFVLASLYVGYMSNFQTYLTTVKKAVPLQA